MGVCRATSSPMALNSEKEIERIETSVLSYLVSNDEIFYSFHYKLWSCIHESRKHGAENVKYTIVISKIPAI